MRSNHIVIAILGFLLFAGPALAGSPEAPKGFRDLAWGASPSKKLKKPLGSSTGGIAIYQPRPGKRLPPLFKVPVAEEAYSFSKGKFFSASAWLDGKENFEKIEAALIKTYGQASKTINNYDRRFVTNKRKNLRKWKWPDSPVEVRLTYDEEYSRATVTYVHTRLNISDTTSASDAAESQLLGPPLDSAMDFQRAP